MAEPRVSFEGARLTYGRTVAVDGLTLSVEAGQIVGLIGRNGAGKTTTLRLALGELFPDAGTVRTLGLDPRRDGRRVRGDVSRMADGSELYGWMRVDELLRFAARLHPSWDADLERRLVSRLELDAGVRIDALSRGGRAKVALIVAVAPRPKLLLLDDPTAGLDPLVRREVLTAVLEQVIDDGGSVIYASHLIGDVERVADRVACLDGGKLVMEAATTELCDRIVCARAVFDGELPAELTLPGMLSCTFEGRLASVVAEAPRATLEAELRQRGATHVEFQTLGLEDILVAMLRRPTSEVEHL